MGKFLPGNPGGPGRPKRGLTIRELLQAAPAKEKQELIKTAYRKAIQDEDVRWAEFIAKHSGEGANLIADVAEAGGTLSFTLHLDSPMDSEDQA